MSGRKRLLTKCDIDGMACGILLKERGLVEEVRFCQAWEIDNGSMAIGDSDITAGLPCRPQAWLAFDHYQDAASVRTERIIVDTTRRSTARVIHDYFGASAFGAVPGELLRAVDRVVSAEVTLDDILYPSGWVLLSHLIDHRTGLERYRRFGMDTAALIGLLTDWCRQYTIWEVLSLPALEERNACYFACAEAYKAQILRCASVHRNLVVVDLRDEETIYPGNRFMIYALFPECNVSLQITRTTAGVAFQAGKSFLDRSFAEDIGRLMRRYGGGGHANAGRCDMPEERADEVARGLTGALRYGSLKNLLLGYYNYYYP
ncbi:hypothetical protein [Trichlorobacter ammonificans]|uniref:Exopolyphosphatase n=1 Tax=Trichlorobacter ammonificans TaxID=2916410 RepID=A0ABN8HG75_9BACT|nr:hypothetical protein [Trichlorobacter ammonificans]CAH2029850.1 conserved protein of unknown function [Trichlorobacter ammonificans]